MVDARLLREESGQVEVVLQGMEAHPRERGRHAVKRRIPRLVEVPEEDDAERRSGHAPPFYRPERADTSCGRLLESASSGPPDEFGSRATVLSEPCQVRKEAALRRKARAPRIARTHRGAQGPFFEYSSDVSDAPAYVPLARKWRPRRFADVVGQDEIVRALTNAVSADRLAHAYLFSGPRGVGKTTTARLLAAAINCSSSDRPTATPCGTCASCVEVLEGRSLDTLEIDGATHGKVDQARDLIEVVAYAPSRDRRKVFIIDEVHAISSAAFQALLKTLEEPPSHAVFILATTERHKIPATILSRCQRFDFRRLTDDEVAGRLEDIALREGFEVVDAGQEAKGGKPIVERTALAALAAAATGSLRDGLSLFDQAAARSGGGVRAEDVAALLGAPDRTALVTLLGAVLASDRIGVFKGCAELEAAGAEPRATLHDLTALVRGAVRLAADPSAPPPTGLSEEGAERVREFARLTPYATLLRLLSLLSESDGTLRRSDVPALAFEVLLLKLAELPRLVPIEEILAGKIPSPLDALGASSGKGAAENGGFSSKVSGAPVRTEGASRASGVPAPLPLFPF